MIERDQSAVCEQEGSPSFYCLGCYWTAASQEEAKKGLNAIATGGHHRLECLSQIKPVLRVSAVGAGGILQICLAPYHFCPGNFCCFSFTLKLFNIRNPQLETSR